MSSSGAVRRRSGVPIVLRYRRSLALAQARFKRCRHDTLAPKSSERFLKMPELVEPIGRLRDILGDLEALSAMPIRRVGHIGDALCHLQYAIDLLDGFQATNVQSPIAIAHVVKQANHSADSFVSEREKVDPLISLVTGPLDKSKLH